MAPSKTPDRYFRPVVGLTAMLAGIAGLITLYFVPVPTGNQQALLLGLGIVLGWGNAVVSSEYGSSTTGRKLADKVADAVQTS